MYPEDSEPEAAQPDAGSFRDRSARVFLSDDRVYRALSAEAQQHWERLAESALVQRNVAAGSLIDTESVAPPAGFPVDDWAGFVEHARVPVISYPYEWSFHMLRQAALLQLDLLSDALAEDWVLKDATPFNVQFRGVSPVHIDLPSFEPYPGGPWEGYRQFCQMFLYPLMLQAWRGVDFRPWLRGRLSGITPAECRALLGARHLWRRGVLSHVYLHAAFEARSGAASESIPQSLKSSGFHKDLISANARKLRRIVEKLDWSPPASTWSSYDDLKSDPTPEIVAKQDLLQSVLSRGRLRTVWDLGCNAGRYSRIAADHAETVLALDSDHLVIDRLFQTLRDEQRTNILPLVFDIADPSPSQGWRGRERSDLPSRSRPDLVICFAVLHHLVLRENLLLDDVVDWLLSLGGDLLIEYVDKSDPQAQRLLQHRRDQYADYSRERLISALEARGEIVAQFPLPARTREVFLVRPRR
jgi:SAM-dependent methyltransferase